MNRTNTLQSILEFASGAENIPSLMHLCDVLQKADTPLRLSISEYDIDKAIDALKDFNHSEISKSNCYTNDHMRETDKNLVSAMAEEVKRLVKDFLRIRGLLLYNT